MDEPKTVQVQEAVLRALGAAATALNKSLEDAIKAIAPDEMTAPIFERPEPIENATSFLKTASQNVGVLARLSKRAVEDGERVAALAKRLARLQKGEKPCRPCSGSGKDAKGKTCPDCNGEGFAGEAA